MVRSLASSKIHYTQEKNKCSFLITLLRLSILLAYSAYADSDVLYPSDENNGWEIVDYDESNMVTLTRTGNITNGDRLFFILFPAICG